MVDRVSQWNVTDLGWVDCGLYEGSDMTKLNVDLSTNVELDILDVMEEMDDRWVEDYIMRNYEPLVRAPSEDALYDAMYQPLYEAMYKA